jgi:shikimate O-hydroxycinnamoyltransferase
MCECVLLQVTRFKCGGITLATNWAHVAADGQSGLHFMKSWSELARGLQVSLLPDHRRELVKPRKFPVSNNPFKASVISAGAQAIDPLESKAETGEGRLQPEESRIEAKVIEFSKDDIAKLKKQAAEQDPSVQLSRADCLSTHLWRTIARVRNLDTSGRARLIYLVEGRKRLSLPEGYFGNVNGPFGSTASLIHSAIPTVTAEWFQDLVDFMHLLQPGRNMFAEDGISPDYNFGVSYLIRFPFYDLDFGFGPPTHSMRNTMGARDGLVFVVPSSHGPEHMVVMANLNPQLMPKFLSMAHDKIPQ